MEYQLQLKFMLSVKLHLQMFETIVTAIENPSEFVRATTDYIKEARNMLNAKLENMPDNEAEVPATSPYKLALRVVGENCRLRNQVKGSKSLIS